MPVTIPWGEGPSGWTWSLPTSLPGVASVDLIAPCTVKGLLQALTPLLPLAAGAVVARTPGGALPLRRHQSGPARAGPRT